MIGINILEQHLPKIVLKTDACFYLLIFMVFSFSKEILVCVCACVCERETETESEKIETKRQRNRDLSINNFNLKRFILPRNIQNILKCVATDIWGITKYTTFIMYEAQMFFMFSPCCTSEVSWNSMALLKITREFLVGQMKKHSLMCNNYSNGAIVFYT